MSASLHSNTSLFPFHLIIIWREVSCKYLLSNDIFLTIFVCVFFFFFFFGVEGGCIQGMWKVPGHGQGWNPCPTCNLHHSCDNTESLCHEMLQAHLHFVWCPGIRNPISPTLFFFLKIAMAILGLLQFISNFRIVLIL